MKLFDRFDKVYCINLKRRPERLLEFQEEVEKYDLGNFEVFYAVDGNNIKKTRTNSLKPSEQGLIESNLKIIKNCIKNKNKNVLVIEDDCVFTEEVVNLEDYFNSLPKDWDMLYMGGNHNTHMNVSPPTTINDKVCKLHHTFSTHFVAIKSTLFSELEFILSISNEPLDVTYTKLQKDKNVYSFYPAIAKQRVGYSDIQNRTVDYNWLIK
jgi:GR25 family glycosyltransferase involved in LPS biosynthesis